MEKKSRNWEKLVLAGTLAETLFNVLSWKTFSIYKSREKGIINLHVYITHLQQLSTHVQPAFISGRKPKHHVLISVNIPECTCKKQGVL